MSGPFGIIRGEEISAYHKNPAISSTQLLDMRPCPAYFYQKHVAKTVPREERREFDVGNAAHWLILEGRKALEERTVCHPAKYHAWSNHKEPRDLGMKDWNWNATACQEWKAREAGDRVILSAEDFATIDRMAAAVGENPCAIELLTGGESEVTFRVQHPAFAVQCRADYYYRAGRVAICTDLKTCDSIEKFKADYFRHRYYYRAAFYQDVIEQADGVLPEFRFVVQEKQAPWRCEVFEPTEQDLDLGRTEMLADLKTLRACIETNDWPNSKLGVQPIELTPYQRKIAAEHGAALYEESAA